MLRDLVRLVGSEMCIRDRAEKDLQKLTDDSSKKIDELLARKEKELMEI